jgi:hypothetical protein
MSFPNPDKRLDPVKPFLNLPKSSVVPAPPFIMMAFIAKLFCGIFFKYAHRDDFSAIFTCPWFYVSFHEKPPHTEPDGEIRPIYIPFPNIYMKTM